MTEIALHILQGCALAVALFVALVTACLAYACLLMRLREGQWPSIRQNIYQSRRQFH